jgi:hypothetical protein
MKKNFKALISLCLFGGILHGNCFDNCTSCSSNDNRCKCRSIFLPRSQGDNLVRQALYRNYKYYDYQTCSEICYNEEEFFPQEIAPHTNVFDKENNACSSYCTKKSCCFYGSLSAEYRFQRSRECCNIARALFGDNNLHFQGSNIISSVDGDPKAILADNFGLSPYVDNTIAFCPRIQNNILDLEFYFGLNEFCDGLFFQVNLPIVNSKWTLLAECSALNTNDTSCKDACSNNCCAPCPLPSPNTTAFNPGCMNSITGGPFTGIGTEFPALPTANTAPATSYASALGGDFLFGDMQTPWTAGRFAFNASEDNRMASVNMILGYNVYECPDYHVGIFARVSAPTGTDLDCCWARNLFSPIIGQNHWGLGAGLTGHAELYRCEDEQWVNLHFEGYVQHLFDRCQARSFDFKDRGCLSRYMLLKQFNADGTYNGKLINAINYTTRKINTQIDVAGEGIFEFVYTNICGFAAGIGYNIYGNSCEKGCKIGDPCLATINTLNLGFKGCAPINALDIHITTANGGVGNTTVDNPVVVSVVTLNSTESNATIHSCGTVDNAVPLNNALPVSAAGANPVNSASLDLNACALNNTSSVTGGALVTNLNATEGAVLIGGTEHTIAFTSAINPVYGPNTSAGGSTTAGQLISSTAAPVTFLGSDVSQLDQHSGLAGSQVTHKLFGHIDYEWFCYDWRPHIYIGGEVEFASDDTCTGMNAWAIYLGFMVGF